MMNLIYALLILIVLGIIVCVYYTFSFFIKEKEIKQKLTYIKFLIRWWVIGKYHCRAPPNAIRFYKTLNRLFWGVVLIGFCLIIAKIMEALEWIF